MRIINRFMVVFCVINKFIYVIRLIRIKFKINRLLILGCNERKNEFMV